MGDRNVTTIEDFFSGENPCSSNRVVGPFARLLQVCVMGRWTCDPSAWRTKGIARII